MSRCWQFDVKDLKLAKPLREFMEAKASGSFLVDVKPLKNPTYAEAQAELAEA